jgi:hypothetical protein
MLIPVPVSQHHARNLRLTNFASNTAISIDHKIFNGKVWVAITLDLNYVHVHSNIGSSPEEIHRFQKKQKVWVRPHMY